LRTYVPIAVERQIHGRYKLSFVGGWQRNFKPTYKLWVMPGPTMDPHDIVKMSEHRSDQYENDQWRWTGPFKTEKP
jgi:hypothetical protein